ncbi:hypothetical protein LOY54_03280 [Pseudomonas sp. B21-032]|uniref:hypothetical protein n=1 Tax=Pseudomonas sp. B21-032 TaxID=2895483 RepID=UPI00215FC07F|nr:hypothetical protein [Pseudomonas sp. B21-032]UVL62306.1 hypothetical protein LOY54_03280 [Pseudomonas sp. B21-032]
MSDEIHLAVVASLLKRGRQVERLADGISLLAVLLGLAALLIGSPAPGYCAVLSGLLLLAGLLQKFFAMRVALDADLFAHLATRSDQLAQHTQALDQSLFSLGLKANPADNRDWQARGLAALGLLRKQLLCFAVQAVLALVGILLLPLLHFAG